MLYQRPRKIDTVRPGKVAKRVLLGSTKNTSHNRRKERALVGRKMNNIVTFSIDSLYPEW